MSEIEIVERPVEECARALFDLEFCALQENVRQDPYLAGALPIVLWNEFLKMSSQLSAQFWTARVDGITVGRVGANLSPFHSERGAVGFFEVDLTHAERDEVSRRLLKAATAWLSQLGAREAYGPLNFNTWFAYRFKVDATDDRQFAWEPVNPPEYPAMFLAAGFAPDCDYLTTCLSDIDAYLEKSRPAYDQALAAGYRLRAFDPEKFLVSDLPRLHALSMEGFKDGYLFEPLGLEAFRALYVPIAQKADLSLSHFILNPAGEAVGFFFCFLDGERVVLKSTAVQPTVRGRGLSNALAYEAVRLGRERGASSVVTALVRTGNQSESYARKSPALWTHRYVLLKQKLK